MSQIFLECVKIISVGLKLNRPCCNIGCCFTGFPHTLENEKKKNKFPGLQKFWKIDLKECRCPENAEKFFEIHMKL